MGYEIQEAVKRVGCGSAQIVPFLVCFIATMADAFEMILLSFIGPMVRCEWQCSKFEEAFLTTIVFMGMIVGGFVWGYLADHRHFGRRNCIVFANAITFGAGIASAFSPNIYSLITLRGILGLGIAGNTLMPFVLFMEILPPKGRGFWASVICWSWSIGAVLLVVFAWILLPNHGWRYLVLISALPGGVCLLISITLLDESPFFHAMHSDRKETMRTLRTMAKSNRMSLPKGEIILNSRDIEERREMRSRSVCAGLCSILTSDIWWTTVRLWFVWFACAFTYYGTILVTTMLSKEDEGWNSESCKHTNDEWGNSETATYVFSEDAYMHILSSTWGELAAALITTLFLDRLGRKFLMTASFATFSFSFLLLSFMETQADSFSDENEDHSSLFILLMFLARMSAAVTLTPTIYVYTSEIYLTEQRASGVSMGYVFARIGGIVVPLVAQILFESTYVVSMLIFVGVGVVSAICSASFEIETTGKHLPHGSF